MKRKKKVPKTIKKKIVAFVLVVFLLFVAWLVVGEGQRPPVKIVEVVQLVDKPVPKPPQKTHSIYPFVWVAFASMVTLVGCRCVALLFHRLNLCPPVELSKRTSLLHFHLMETLGYMAIFFLVNVFFSLCFRREIYSISLVAGFCTQLFFALSLFIYSSSPLCYCFAWGAVAGTLVGEGLGCQPPSQPSDNPKV